MGIDFAEYEGLDFERRPNGVLAITINRHPERLNAVNEALHNNLGRIWRDIDQDDETRVAVITGKGRGFSAGGDMEMELRLVGNFDAIAREMQVARNIVLNMVNCDKPIISAINGPAAGAGLAVALLADITVMAEEATFTDGHTRIGVAAGDHATIIWPLLCGMAKAKYYLLTAERIDGREAERIGLVSKAVPLDGLLDEVFAIADRLAVGPQHAIRWTKRSLNHWLRDAQPIFEASLGLEMLNFFGADVGEGLQAFMEKRTPSFE